MKRILNFLIKHKIFVLIVLAVLVGVIVRQQLTKNQTAPTFQTAKVERGNLVSSISVSGQVITSGRLPILSQASGQVQEVFIKNGDSVVAGQKILTMTLDPSASQKNASAWSSYLSSVSQLKAAQAKINSLQSTLFKTNQTFVTGRGVNNPSDAQKADPVYIEQNAEWLQAEADYKNQQNVIAAAQASVNAAWQNYQQTSPDLVAPAAGIIQDLTYVPGMLISGSVSTSGITQSQTITSIVTSSLPTIAVNLSEVDVNRVAEGNKATVSFDAIENKTFPATVVGINKTGMVSSGVTNYPATIQLTDSPTEVLPNMSASADIILATKQNVLIVPSEAVQTQNGQSSIRILKNGRSQITIVKTGLTSETQTEILSGAEDGDVVITGSAPTVSPTGPSNSPFSTFRVGTGTGGAARTGGQGR